MADHSIMFKIGSIFTGEGFEKAKAAVETSNNSMRRGIGVAMAMSSAMGGMDTSAAKAAKAMTGLIGAFMAGGPAGLVMSAALMGMNAWITRAREDVDKLTERANAMKAAMEASFSSTLKGRISDIKSEVAAIRDGFERIAKEATALTAAFEGVRAANAAGGIAQLQVDKLNAMLEAHSEAERQNAEASYNLLIAQAELTEAEQAGSQRVAAAAEIYELNKQRLAAVDEQMATLGEERASLEATMLAAKASGDEHWVKIQEQVNALKDQESELLTQRLAIESEGQILELKLQQTKTEADNATLAATAAVKQAELAQNDLNARVSERAASEANAKAKADDAAREQEELTTALKDAKDAQQAVNDANRALETAQREYEAAVRAYNANFGTNKVNEAYDDYYHQAKGKGGVLPVAIQNRVQAEVSAQAVEDAINKGLINTVADADRMARQAAREARDQMNKNSGQRSVEAQKYERLMGQNFDKLSKQDQDFIKTYDQLRAAQTENRKAVEDAAKKVADAKEYQKRSASTLDVIKEKLDKLGLR